MLTEYDYTGGSNGLSLRPLLQIADVDAARQVEYYLMFALLIACLLALYWVANSPIGLFLAGDCAKTKTPPPPLASMSCATKF